MRRGNYQARRDEDPEAHAERLKVERGNYQARRDNENPDARADRLTVERGNAQAKRDEDPEAHEEHLAVRRENDQAWRDKNPEAHAEHLFKCRDRGDALYARSTLQQRAETRQAHNKKCLAWYHQNKSTVHSKYKGVFEYKGGTGGWKASYMASVPGGGGGKRKREDGPFDTEAEAARAWDKLRSSEPGFKKSKLLNFPDEYDAAVATGAGAAAAA